MYDYALKLWLNQINSRSLVMILIFAIFIIVNFIAFDLVSRDDITHFQVSDEVFATNSTNRAKCHGHTVQEYNDFSAITDNGLTVHEIKSIILVDTSLVSVSSTYQ